MVGFSNEATRSVYNVLANDSSAVREIRSVLSEFDQDGFDSPREQLATWIEERLDDAYESAYGRMDDPLEATLLRTPGDLDVDYYGLADAFIGMYGTGSESFRSSMSSAYSKGRDSARGAFSRAGSRLRGNGRRKTPKSESWRSSKTVRRWHR